MNKIDKKLLDELLDLHRGVAEAITAEEIRESVSRCMDKSDEIAEKNPAVCSYSLDNLAHSILSIKGMNRDASSEDIYKVLEVLGWEVVE